MGLSEHGKSMHSCFLKQKFLIVPIESILVIENICTFCLGLKEEESVSSFVVSNSVISWTVARQALST